MSKYIDAIDRGQLIRDILDEYGDIGGTEDANKIYRMILNQPTANVRENIRGEWLHDEVTMNGNTVYTPNAKCSICDCYVFQESNFCPNCGAKMRER